MNTEQERAAFEWWASDEGESPRAVERVGECYKLAQIQSYWMAWQARAALQAQPIGDASLFCDMKTDEEKAAFFLSGRGYETGVIAQAIQNDVAMAYHRCAEYKKELDGLQSQDREDAERYRYLIAKLQQAYDGDYFETDLMSLYCQMPSQYKGERVVRAEISWRDKADEPIGLSEAIDHARRVEGVKND